MRKLISSKIIFFLITTITILSLNLTPLILQTLHSPKDRTFALIHNNTQDYFFYQSLMNQGANGEWLTSDSYTSELHESSIIFSYFLWLGKISALLGIPYPLLYHSIRLIFAILFLLTAYYLLFTFNISHPRLTYFFFLFSAPFLHEIDNFGTKQTSEYMNWWTGMDPIRRAAYLPHHMIGSFLLLVSLILIVKYIEHKRWKYIFWLSLSAVVLAFIHTPSLFILLIILPPTLAIYYLINKKIIENFHFGLLAYWLIGLLALLFMVSQTQKGFPWSQYIDWEKSLQYTLDKELIGALGFLFPFALLGIIKALRPFKFSHLLIVTWFTVPFLLIPAAPTIGISNIRLIQGVPYLPLAILAVFGVKTIGQFLVRIHIPSILKIKNWHLISLWYGIFLTLFTIFTVPTLIWSLKDQVREFWAIYGNVYFDDRLMDAFDFINKNLPPKTVTIATFYAGNYIPAFTDTTSFIGHAGYTYNLSKKEPVVKKFFEGDMSDVEAKQFLISNKIDIVFQGPEEMILRNQKIYPGILKPIFDNGVVVIYKLI